MADLMNNIIDDVATYYSEKLEKHGTTPQGVDWNGEESQALRFTQLIRIVDQSVDVSINDIGCGYGALYDFLSPRFPSFRYNGYDIAEDMVLAARNRHASERAEFHIGAKPETSAQFGIASGIFNVKLDWSDAAWLEYVVETLDTIDQTSARGFSFNCLTSYSDPDKMRPNLYYANPSEIFDICKRKYSRNVAVLHDYGLYEFTVLVRKQL